MVLFRFYNDSSYSVKFNTLRRKHSVSIWVQRSLSVLSVVSTYRVNFIYENHYLFYVANLDSDVIMTYFNSERKPFQTGTTVIIKNR